MSSPSASPGRRDAGRRDAGRRDAGRRDAGRGQTTIDFAIGAGVFLLVVAFTFAFVPSMFGPFLDNSRPQAADRAATTLASDSLGTPSQPSLLNRTCTVGFFYYFQNDTPVTSSCRFDTAASTVQDALGIPDYVQVNVSIQTTDGTVMSLDTVRLATGDSPPDRTAVTTARRSVRLADATRRLVVHTW